MVVGFDAFTLNNGQYLPLCSFYMDVLKQNSTIVKDVFSVTVNWKHESALFK